MTVNMPTKPKSNTSDYHHDISEAHDNDIIVASREIFLHGQIIVEGEDTGIR